MLANPPCADIGSPVAVAMAAFSASFRIAVGAASD
jgi:hypothetical protein